jgi:outer membrane protein TolC
MHRWLPLFICAIWASTASAEDPALSFQSAIERAPLGPHLVERRAGVEAHQALARALSGLDENPEITVYPGWRFGPEGSERFEVQAQLTQGFALGDLRGAQRMALSREAAVLQAAIRDGAMTARRVAARAWVARWAAQARFAAAQGARAQAEAFVAHVARAVEAGVVTVDALAEARVEAAQAALAVVDAEGDMEDEGHRLGRALSDAQGQALGAQGALPEPPLPPAEQWPALLAKAQRLPEPVRLRLAAAAADARAVEVFEANRGRVTAGLMAQTDDGFTAFAVLGVELPVVDGGARERAGLLAEAHGARGDATRAAALAIHDLTYGLHEVAHAREVEQSLKGQLLPALEALVDARDRAFSAGQATVFGVLRARTRLARAQVALVEARADRARAEIDAWLLLAAADEEEP